MCCVCETNNRIGVEVAVSEVLQAITAAVAATATPSGDSAWPQVCKPRDALQYYSALSQILKHQRTRATQQRQQREQLRVRRNQPNCTW